MNSINLGNLEYFPKGVNIETKVLVKNQQRKFYGTTMEPWRLLKDSWRELEGVLEESQSNS